jgi:DNA invertase Pin-like site-specific DNA recombinase
MPAASSKSLASAPTAASRSTVVIPHRLLPSSGIVVCRGDGGAFCCVDVIAALQGDGQRLVAWLCAGDVGAVLCFDASRLARNGRDWHHLLELCGLVEARVIDMEGVYDPCRPNDRLLLGMKGSISEFELRTMRARMLDAARHKARRGELSIFVPFGYLWHREIGLGLDPDLRMQESDPPGVYPV